MTAYVVAVWALHLSAKPRSRLRTLAVPVTAGAIVASSATPQPVLATGILLAALVAVNTIVARAGVRSGRSDDGVSPIRPPA